MMECKVKGNSNATINRKFSCLSKIFSTARTYNKCNQVPSMTWQDEPPTKIRWLTWEEEDQLLQYFIEKPEMQDLIMLGCDTGMRVSEMFSVPFTDYQDGFVRIWVNKSDKPRSVPLTPRVLEMIGRRQMMDPYSVTPFSISYLGKKTYEKSIRRVRFLRCYYSYFTSHFCITFGARRKTYIQRANVDGTQDSRYDSEVRSLVSKSRYRRYKCTDLAWDRFGTDRGQNGTDGTDFKKR